MTRKILSICIPTHNRSDFLKLNLEKIAKIAPPNDMEIVVADDFSPDNTRQVVEEFKKKHKKFSVSYKRFTKRVYFDKMVLSIVEMAKGEFCWLLGDDDLPEKESINNILKVIKNHPQVSLIHLNYSRFDNILKKVTAARMVGDFNRDKVYKNLSDFYFLPLKKGYFDFLGTNVITMSTDVVNRKKWLEAAKKIKKFVGHNFIHCFAIGTMIHKHSYIYYLATPQVQYLANNHRVWPNNIWQDYNHVLLGYLKKIGYPGQEIEQMQKVQSKFEKSESLTKNPVFKLILPFAQRGMAIYRYVTNKAQ